MPPVTAHEEAAAATVARPGERVKQEYRVTAGPQAEPRGPEVIPTPRSLPADTTFSSPPWSLDLGDRQVELVHPGRGHTAGRPGARGCPTSTSWWPATWWRSHLSARCRLPGMGADCYPLEWPLTLDIVLSLTTSRASVVVPGHGAVVDRDFVEVQRNTIGIVAETVRDLASRGVPASHRPSTPASGRGPREQLGDAVARAYAHLPRSQKRLPLI